MSDGGVSQSLQAFGLSVGKSSSTNDSINSGQNTRASGNDDFSRVLDQQRKSSEGGASESGKASPRSGNTVPEERRGTAGDAEAGAPADSETASASGKAPAEDSAQDRVVDSRDSRDSRDSQTEDDAQRLALSDSNPRADVALGEIAGTVALEAQKGAEAAQGLLRPNAAELQPGVAVTQPVLEAIRPGETAELQARSPITGAALESLDPGGARSVASASTFQAQTSATLRADGAQGDASVNADLSSRVQSFAEDIGRGREAIVNVRETGLATAVPSSATVVADSAAAGAANRGPDGALTSFMPGTPLTSTSSPLGSANAMPQYTLMHAPTEPEFAQEVSARMQTMLRDGLHEAKLQLNPAELGRLQVTITTEGDQARVFFVAENAAARDVIEQSLPKLRDMLEQSGLQLAQSDVGQQRGDDREPGGFAEGGAEASTGGDAAGTLPSSGRMQWVKPSGIDTYV